MTEEWRSAAAERIAKAQRLLGILDLVEDALGRGERMRKMIHELATRQMGESVPITDRAAREVIRAAEGVANRSGLVVRLISQAEELSRFLSRGRTRYDGDDLRLMRETVERDCRLAHRVLETAGRSLERAETPDVADPPDRSCIRCRRRPRHFDDLCKRCANETGQRPTGPVR